ncbi:hypothetical protein Dimus_036010 [Dionaea muscipula]
MSPPATVPSTDAAAVLSLSMLLLLLLLLPATAAEPDQDLNTATYTFGLPFNSSYNEIFAVQNPATISNDALQITPDSAGNFTLFNRSGRVLFKQPFKLWNNNGGGDIIASFNTSFLLNIYRINGSAAGEGMAFVISPDIDIPPASDGGYLGLTNSTTNGRAPENLITIEFDTFKPGSDPDNNHIGLNINNVISNKTTSLSDFNITLAPNGTKFHVVWIQYNGRDKSLAVYMAEQDNDAGVSVPQPDTAVLTAEGLDMSQIVKQYSYFGFSASTGNQTSELHCVLSWNLTVEVFPDDGFGRRTKVAISVTAGVVVLAAAATGLWWYLGRRRRRKGVDASEVMMGALKALPGMPREFELRELKRATGNFDEKKKLGQGGYGVVYKGVIPAAAGEDEDVEVAVKKFSRDETKSRDDFFSELTIINRLRHKNLVRLLGWCHKNGMLLLVYEFMPNCSLDKHIFCGEDTPPLTWFRRYNILTGVAAALHYLHNEYDNTVLHRDLKASNVLLDSSFNARLGDFGLARAIDPEKTSYSIDVHASGGGGAVQGTLGYIAPEVFHTGRATRDSDVYAFGALLLEVACGQRPWTRIAGFSCLVDWVWSLHREGRITAGVDGRLGKDFVAEEAERVLQLGLACSHPIAAERPKMKAIVQILSGGSADLPRVPPFKPAFVWAAMEAGQVGCSLELEVTADTMPILASSSFEAEWTLETH